MKNVEVTRLNQIYSSSSGDVKVYHGEMTGSATPVAIKEQRFDTVEDSNLAVQEALVQKSLHHPNICKLYSVTLTSEGSRILVTTLLEWMNQGDLQVEIERRRELQEFFSESELFCYLRDLTSAFATAQRLGICHRDIKPQNLLLDSGVIKICDFGCSKEAVDTISSLQGSPYFLSPALKEVLRDNFGSENYPDARHDAYKSDVYSLGLTFLFMAKLQPSVGITNLASLPRETEQEVNTLKYSSRLKDVLLFMLTEDESSRPDFLGLETHLNSMQLVIEEEKVPLEPVWVTHLRAKKPVVATVTLPLVCTQCSKSYLLDVSHGCNNIMDLYFCKSACFDAYYSPHPMEPNKCGICGAFLSAGTCSKNCLEAMTRRGEFETSKELMKKQRVCYMCGKKLTKTDGEECAECHQKELNRWVVTGKNTHECIFCRGKWEKRRWGAEWFRKKEGRIKLKCGHRFCSRVCFDRFTQSNRACTSCGKVLDAAFLKFMKIA